MAKKLPNAQVNRYLNKRVSTLYQKLRENYLKYQNEFFIFVKQPNEKLIAYASSENYYEIIIDLIKKNYSLIKEEDTDNEVTDLSNDIINKEA